MILLIVALILITILIVRAIYKPKIDQEKSLTIEGSTNRDYGWIKFIQDYKSVAKTSSEKTLIDRMLSDIKSNGWLLPGDQVVKQDAPAIIIGPESVNNQSIAQVNSNIILPSKVKSKSQIQLDNASLLLYFGAFLFVASTGLFVVFGGIPGGLRIFIVSLVAAIMYCSGIWLFKNKPKLKQAGMAFAGIGMAITPLIGLTAYNYLFNKSHATTIWFLTSIISLGLYAHSLIVIRKPLINYILIFTFLSLFESGISIINAPIYYYGWMLAAVGILLSLIGRIKGIWPDFAESTWYSSAVFLPLAVLVSLALAPSRGFLQLGISLILAAGYYGVEILYTKDITKATNAAIAHISFNLGISAILYAYSHSLPIMAAGIIVLSVIQVGLILFITKESIMSKNFATIILTTQIVTVFLSWQKINIMLFSLVALLSTSTLIWLKQKRYDSYFIAALSLMFVPILYGHYYLTIPYTIQQITLLLLAALLIQLAVFLVVKNSISKTDSKIADYAYFVSSLIVIVASLMTGHWFSVYISIFVSLTALLIAQRYKHREWAVISGVFVAIPLILGTQSSGAFLATNIAALVLNILISLYYRTEPNRWFSTILWLLLPISLGNGVLGSSWSINTFAWVYLLVMFILVISRAIARGVLFLSDHVPVVSYARSASISYVLGYSLATIVTVALSLFNNSNWIYSSLILSILTILIWIISRYIEKQNKILILIPVFIQIVILSLLRPSSQSNIINLYLLISIAVSVVGYIINSFIKIKDEVSLNYKIGSLITIFIAPVSVLFIQSTYWPMPLGLIVAGLLVFNYIGNQRQNYRELTLGIVTIGIFWLMGFWGIHAVQAYSHVLVVQFALYAYWRYSRKEVKQSDSYIYVMLATATIPLVVQALASQAGGLYGWWLLLEQVLFMVIGMTIGKRFVTLWGLYVAVGAVLYQLRNLGWAALTVLAVFLIGLAIHKIQKNS